MTLQSISVENLIELSSFIQSKIGIWSMRFVNTSDYSCFLRKKNSGQDDFKRLVTIFKLYFFTRIFFIIVKNLEENTLEFKIIKKYL